MELGKRQLTSREEVKFMSEYNVVMSTAESTVVTEYEPQQTRSDAYQSEAALENAFIKMLTEQGYQYLKIDSPSALIDNLRHQLEKLNNYTFSDMEWKQFFENKIANSNEGIVEKTRKIQEDHIQVLRRDDGSSKNIYLIDKANIHNNSLQVINQYVEEGGAHDTRYDVTILVNGLPLVHIELKRRGVPIKEAFNQIERYQRDSFWAGCGLYEYVQVFVISNGTNTKYYSNTTRNAHIKEQNGKRSKGKKTSNSFEFTSFWADGNNRVIADLVDFTKTFFANEILKPIDFQDYTGTYNDLYQEFKKPQGDKDSIKDDIVFEMELVKQVEVNIDYILMLVAKYHQSNCKDKEILASIDKAISASLQLRSKKELIDGFISTINVETNVTDDWGKFVQEQKKQDIDAIITEQRLKPEETIKFIDNSFRDGVLKTTGTDIDKIMPPVSRFGSAGKNRSELKQKIIDILQKFFEKYRGLV